MESKAAPSPLADSAQVRGEPAGQAAKEHLGEADVRLRRECEQGEAIMSQSFTRVQEPWMKTTAFKSRKHVKAVDAPRHRHGR